MTWMFRNVNPVPRSILFQVKAWCMTAPSHSLNQCWFILKEVGWHSRESKGGQMPKTLFCIMSLNITATCPRDQSVDGLHLVLTYHLCSGNELQHMYGNYIPFSPWWRHQMETFSVLLAFCAENSPVTGEFPSQRTVMPKLKFSLICAVNKRLSI